MASKLSIMVIGGGITGLSSAYYLQKRLKAEGVEAQLTLVEKGTSFGGKINTLERDGFVIERGPDSFLSRKRPIIDLSLELGLGPELTGTNPQAKKTYILRQGKLHRMPPGLVLGIPTEMTPFMRTGLISPLGKVRAAMDMLLPKGANTADESLGHFLERRLGKEVLERIAEPLLAGIYAGDTYALSVRATFPQFREMERKKRSLILGMMANRKATQAEAADLPPIARNSVFLTYRKGLQTLVKALLLALQEVDMRTGESVVSIERKNDQVEVLFDNGRRELVDGVILTSPAYQVPALLSRFPAANELSKIRYVSVANVIMAFDRKDIPFPLDASGFVVPRSEGRTITACTWTSAKWLHTAPEGKVLLRCYVGRSGEEAWMGWDDETLLSKVRGDISELLGIHAEPLFHEITRMPNSMPQYPVGHLELVAEFRKKLDEEIPGLFVTGSGFHGVGLPDCIRQGNEAAQHMFKYVQERAAEPSSDKTAN
ncbi:protoporphyrinogen oxidase [Paenibacillus eucommiae]|uniref:Coproporphyrinogen III oxidase n=1 Tax=Paenibacillus eucommiae TaxID=1355755 RepID=A0ABS4JA18_9BACL|nr:protoporphyrinogen oxidase [Paenibacillus eucommiae]MBP1995936.1 oxygen-dependent protoporphyrinogen oxidase [Paenibacillus eucommiae]